MNRPTITIGITCYNAELTISSALDSALDQTYNAQEIIIVDDSSKDNTVSIIDKYSSVRQNIFVFKNKFNSGVAYSRNLIIENATGEFLAFFDDDDISDPRRLELQLSRILEYERNFTNDLMVLCHTAREQFFPNGIVQIEPALGQEASDTAPFGLDVARHALMGMPISGGYGSCATCSQMARTNVYRQLGGFLVFLRRCSDFELAVRFARAGGHFLGISEPLVKQSMTLLTKKFQD